MRLRLSDTEVVVGGLLQFPVASNDTPPNRHLAPPVFIISFFFPSFFQISQLSEVKYEVSSSTQLDNRNALSFRVFLRESVAETEKSEREEREGKQHSAVERTGDGSCDERLQCTGGGAEKVGTLIRSGWCLERSRSGIGTEICHRRSKGEGKSEMNSNKHISAFCFREEKNSVSDTSFRRILRAWVARLIWSGT